jgi:hypothetical protein
MKRKSESRWLLAGLLASIVVLAVTGVSLLGAYFYLSRQPASNAASARSSQTGWYNPLDFVKADAIAPDLAVLPLAGEADDRVIRAALDAGETETAYAGLAYSLLSPDNVRSGHWLLLAGDDRERDPVRSAVGYQAALDQVALAPTLSDAARADVSLQVARGYAALKQDKVARLALAQAESIARYSLTLLPAQRHALLEQVASAHESLGDASTAAAVRRELDVASAGPGITLAQRAPILPRLRGEVVLPSDIVSALVARQGAAATMAARWLSANSDVRAELSGQLGEALLKEDGARSAFYAAAGDLSLANRLALLHDKIAWLTIKYRVANRAYGISLVPTWELQTQEIKTELTDAYVELINGYGQLLDTLPPAEAAPARVELLRQAVLWGRLGLFPDYPEATLSTQLGEASTQLWTRQGSAGLTVVAQDSDSRRLYLLSGSGPVQPPG